MFLRVKKSGDREYLQIVESSRDKGHVRQRVIGTIGRMEELLVRGQIDQLLRSLAKYSRRAILLLSGTNDPEAHTEKIGPEWIFGRLWKHTGIAGHIKDVLRQRR